MDATILDCLLARARTTTQSRETDLTHRTDRRVVVGGDAVGFDAGGFAATLGVGGGALRTSKLSGAATTSRAGVLITVSTAGALSRTDTTFGAGMESRVGATWPPATMGWTGVLSTRAIAGAGVAVSATGAAGIDLTTAALLTDRVSRGDRSFSSHAVPTIAKALAAATPRSTCGQMGGRSGLVPHHLHCPTVSG